MPTESIPPAAVVWLRQDLRLSDAPAFEATVAWGVPVVAARVHDPLEEGAFARRRRPASRLAALQAVRTHSRRKPDGNDADPSSIGVI